MIVLVTLLGILACTPTAYAVDCVGSALPVCDCDPIMVGTDDACGKCNVDGC